ncbi:cutinase family protein [Tomitella biformata]|uniref:cutinase family protein n=1 Tax=Tomitella biformata TaxID=630403 RepID=UPI0004660E3E|nr:cutinase family protein [Tomitella biformata]
MSRGKKRGGGGKLVLGGLVLAAIVIAIIALVFGLTRTQTPPVPGGPTPTPGPEEPQAQPASCPDVQVISVPGTWESSPTDDPHHPTANPAALLLNVTGPLQEQFPESRVDVMTVPYVAQFARPMAPPEATYDDSRAQGKAAAENMIRDRTAECPLTNFVLMGFSQGAVIAGDIASDIGNGVATAPISADRVLGVGLIADGRRDTTAPAAGLNLGVPGGKGAEVLLAGLNLGPLMPGTTMTGPRPGGFGVLADRAVQICAPGDLICDAPAEVLTNLVGTIAQLSTAASAPIHAIYHTNPIIDGTTATAYLTDWAAGLIQNAPTPAHN